MPEAKVLTITLDEPFEILGLRATVRHKRRGQYTIFAERLPAAECRPALAKIEPERKRA